MIYMLWKDISQDITVISHKIIDNHMLDKTVKWNAYSNNQQCKKLDYVAEGELTTAFAFGNTFAHIKKINRADSV